MFLVSSCSCLCPIQWSHVLSREWRCGRSSADRRCSDYIWVIDNFIAYGGASYIRDLTVHPITHTQNFSARDTCGPSDTYSEVNTHFVYPTDNWQRKRICIHKKWFACQDPNISSSSQCTQGWLRQTIANLNKMRAPYDATNEPLFTNYLALPLGVHFMNIMSNVWIRVLYFWNIFACVFACVHACMCGCRSGWWWS